MDFAVGVSRADDGGFSIVAEEPGVVDLYLGPMAWRRARRRRGDRDHDDRGDVAVGDDLLDLRAQAAACGVVGVDSEQKSNHKGHKVHIERIIGFGELAPKYAKGVK